MPVNKAITWGSEELKERYEKRMAEIDADPTWIRAYDTPPEDGQKVIYTFPEMGNGVYEGAFSLDRVMVNPYTEERTVLEHPIHTFHSKHGYLGDDDVYWKPIDKKACDSKNPDVMCNDCNCWKKTREYCS